MPPSRDSLDADHRMLPVVLTNPDSLFDAYYASLPDSTSHAITDFTNRIRGTELCTPEEEVAYATAIQAGQRASELVQVQSGIADPSLTDVIVAGEKATQEFFERNLRLVSWMARMTMNLPAQISEGDKGKAVYSGAIHGDLTTFSGSPMPLADRVQEAAIGLLQAVKTFMPIKQSNGEYIRFSTYATYRVESRLVKGIYNYGLASGARYPYKFADDQRALRRSEEWLAAKKGHDNVTDEAIAADLGKPLGHVTTLRALDRSHQTVPLDSFSPFAARYEQDPDAQYDDQDNEEVLRLHDLLATDDDMGKRIITDEIIDSIEEVLASLPHREAEILRLRYGIGTEAPQTLEQVGQVMGITRERVRQIQAKTLERILASPASKKLALLIEPETNGENRHRSGISEHLIIAARNQRRSAIEKARAVPTPPRTARQELLAAEIKAAKEAQHMELDYAALSNAFRESAALFKYSGQHMSSLGTVNAAIRKIYRDSGLRTIGVLPITKLWHNDIAPLIESVGGIENFNTDVFSLVFSRLLADCALNAKQEIVLTIPAVLDGELNHFASGFGYGRLQVIGNLGDRAGEYMGNGAELLVVGNVGDLAGTLMGGNAKMYVAGSCGSEAGYRMRGYSALTIGGKVGPGAGKDLQGVAKVHTLIREKLIAQSAFEAIKPTPDDFMDAVTDILGHTIDGESVYHRLAAVGAQLNNASRRAAAGDVKGLEFFVYGSFVPKQYHKHRVFVALDGSLVTIRPYLKRIDEPFSATVMPRKYGRVLEVIDKMRLMDVSPALEEAANAQDQVFIVELLRRFAARFVAHIEVQDAAFPRHYDTGGVPRLKLKRQQIA
ncbi:MAG: rpoD [Candidatus Saccharibacteria bacterium]|nr:rpoD [Candidatus Saccharibacteria bacterium]